MQQSPIVIPEWGDAASMPEDRSPPGPSEEQLCSTHCRVTCARINNWLAEGAGTSQVFYLPAAYQQTFIDMGCIDTLTEAGFSAVFFGDRLTVAKP